MKRCLVRRDRIPIVYYTNILISSLIQICTMIIWAVKLGEDQMLIICLIFVFFGVLASLYFKMCIALERHFFIACPLLDCIRQTKGSVLVCAVIWVLCLITAPLVIIQHQSVRLLIFALFPAPLLVFCLAGAVKALPAATSVPPDEKRRIVGSLVLMLLNYFLMILPQIVCFIGMASRHTYNFEIPSVVLTLFLLCPIVDLSLLFFMWEGSVEKLSYLCCCIKNVTTADVADHQRD